MTRFVAEVTSGMIEPSACQEILEKDSGISENYQHGPKLMTPGDPMATSGAVFKWYRLAPANDPVTEAIDQLARAYLTKTRLDAKGFGFVILHRCGTTGFHFLIVNTWRGNNEVWETLYCKQDDATPDFALFPRDGIHKPTFCVWELAAVWHEAKAWEQFLQSNRSPSALQLWLNNCYSGAA